MGSWNDTTIISFDTETTGLDTTTARVVELALVASTALSHGHLFLWERRLNPGIPIPVEATAVHGISDSDVANCPDFKCVGSEFARRLYTGTALLGFNALGYDVPLLDAEFERADLPDRIDTARVIDPLVFARWHLRHIRSRALGALCAHFGVVLLDAHRAAGDARATLSVFNVMVAAQLIPATFEAAITEQIWLVSQLATETAAWGHWIYRDRDEGTLMFGAGKHTGVALQQAPYGTLKWCLSLPDLHEGAAAEFRAELGRRRQQQATVLGKPPSDNGAQDW